MIIGGLTQQVSGYSYLKKRVVSRVVMFTLILYYY